MDPARHRRDLARALASLGTGLSVLGDLDAAAGVLSEADGEPAPAGRDRPDGNLAGLTRALDSLAAALARLGQQEEADAVCAEADSLAAGLARLGQQEEADAVCAEADSLAAGPGQPAGEPEPMASQPGPAPGAHTWPLPAVAPGLLAAPETPRACAAASPGPGAPAWPDADRGRLITAGSGQAIVERIFPSAKVFPS